jgi:hypothetical protein
MQKIDPDKPRCAFGTAYYETGNTQPQANMWASLAAKRTVGNLPKIGHSAPLFDAALRSMQPYIR